MTVAAVLDPAASPHPFVAALEGAGVAVVPLRMSGRAYLDERRRIVALCETLKPSVVHSHGYRSDVVDATAAHGAGVPTITTLHGFTGGGLRDRLYEYLQVRACRRLHAVVAVSDPIRARVIASGVPAGKVQVIRNAFTPGAEPLERAAARAALGVPLEGIRVGFVGRLSAEKGADVLVRAVPGLAASGVAVSVIGAGPQRDELEALAAGLGVRDRITWHGLVADAARLYRAFDVFVLSSRTEGTPIALLEAMAAGVPVVATRVGGVPDVVSDDEAVLVPSERPEAVAAAVTQVLRDGAETQRRVAAARRVLAARFAEEPWLAAYERVYASVARS